ncbi:hypothetical protein AB205_0071660 [Aquarana catesbeiana]|uniref:Uncharacterized protein n=1 Tax=Aquarana catesbeiana TaxID=8400 RepID=A0A2G9SBM7_AQUCT|nr:hypothetical protein AB205_0071660 [Aquarana catesbeiana]
MFNIENLLVERYDDGSFSIRGNPDASTSSTSNNKELNHIGSINCDHTKSIQHRSNATKCTQTLCDNPVQAEPIEGNKSYNQKAMAVSTEQVRFPASSSKREFTYRATCRKIEFFLPPTVGFLVSCCALWFLLHNCETQ